MARFVLEVVDASGIARRETVEAPDRRAALDGLGERRRFLRRLEVEGEGSSESRAAPGTASVAPEVGSVARVARELERLVSLGVALSPALAAVGRAQGRGALGPALEKAAARAREGASLADALREARGPLAEPVFLELLVAGEGSGELGRALGDVALHASRQELVRRRFAGAVAYPAFLAAFGTVLLALVATVCAGPAASLSEAALADGRHPTAIVEALAAADGRAPLLWGAAALTVALVLAVRRLAVRALATAAGEARATAVPLLGALRARLGRRARAALALRALAALVTRGVPLARAWACVAGLLGLEAPASLSEGAGLGAALAAAHVLAPAEHAALAAVASAGPDAQAEVLASFADSREAAFERAAEGLAAAVEPALELAVGLAIALVGVGLVPLVGVRS